MTRAANPPPTAAAIAKAVRCAIYTRKSTEDGLEQEFNSLDAQREGCAAYIASQKGEGWQCLPDSYDDGGFSGGNTDRPALQRLLADIQAGKIDAVVVYKLDRFSRSIADFHRLMEIFTQYGVAFVSITQQFNTTTSMGRMVLNMLLTFAQFERELISERTRDKIAAARRKGKWSGGMPVLGYDVDDHCKLVINAAEAVMVRGIFELYIQHQAMMAVLKELDARGWKSKQWTTRKETLRGGKPFDKFTLRRLLTNVVYRGRVRYKTEIHPGEHEAIVPEVLWDRVQTILRRNRQAGGAAAKNRYGALLRGLLHCTACNCGMVHAYTVNGTKRYRYYVCLQAQKRGWHTCPAKSVPAGQIEQFVIDQIRRIGRDPSLVAETISQAQRQVVAQLEQIDSEMQLLHKQIKACALKAKQVVARGGDAAVLAEIEGQVQTARTRVSTVEQEKTRLQQQAIDQAQSAQALAKFDPVWEALTPRERVQLIELLIGRVDYDGRAGEVRITFNPTGIQSLGTPAQEVAA